MPGRRLLTIVVGMLTMASFGLVPALGSSSSTVDPGIGNVPQGLQSDQAYAKSFNMHAVTNVFVTGQQVSCYRPEVPYSANNGPNDGYTGESPCPGATTGEDTGATHLYPTQVGSDPPYPAAQSMLVKDRSESDIRVDPTKPSLSRCGPTVRSGPQIGSRPTTVTLTTSSPRMQGSDKSRTRNGSPSIPIEPFPTAHRIPTSTGST